MTPNTQHRSGRSVDPSLLEQLGKQAAASYGAEPMGSLTDAVVQTISHYSLNSEQIRRVVEAANTEAYNSKFASTSGVMRAVRFDGGPADVTEVMEKLNAAARPKEVMLDSIDYAVAPYMGQQKQSSAVGFELAMLRTRAGVMGNITALQSKLSSAHDEIVQGREAACGMMNEAMERLAHAVKTASLDGATPEELYQAWFAVDPELAKLAVSKTKSLMRRDNEKVAGRRIRADASVVSEFAEFAKQARLYVSHTTASREMETELARIADWLRKQSS